MFLYFGHGSAEQYIARAALRRLARCAGSLLMGCSSGRLRGGGGGGGLGGGYEPSGAIWSYLLAGCPAAVANLWDVTDRWGACAGSRRGADPRAQRARCT
jgi:separase